MSAKDARAAAVAAALIDESAPLLSEEQTSYGGPSADEERNISSVTAASEPADQDAVAPSKVSPTAVVLVLVIGVFIAQLDTSFVLATHSQIASEFGQLSNSSWIIAGYSLAMCAVQPCFGKVSDVFGRRGSLLTAYLLFALGSAICGIARSLAGVVVGRAIAGVGGAGVGALVSLIILDLVPLREVARLRSYVNIAATLGRSLGGPIGGALTDSIGWRWSFLIQCPLLLVAGIVAAPLVPTKREPEEVKIMTKLRRIDFAGAGLLAINVTTLMLVLELAGQKLPWNHPVIFVLIAVSLGAGILFLITETYWATEPVFPLHLLRNRNVITAYLLLGLQISAQFSLMYCIPLYFEVIQNAPSAVAGAHLFPAVAGNTLGALLTGWIIHRTGRYKILAVLATVSAVLCYSLLIIRWRGNTNIWESLYIFPGGFGTGMAEATAFISLSSAVERSMQSIALSGLFQSTNVGAIVGLATSSAVLQLTLQSQLQTKLDGFDNKEKIIEKAISDISYVMKLTGKLHVIVVSCYVKALEYTHTVSLVCSLIALVAALAIKQRAL